MTPQHGHQDDGLPQPTTVQQDLLAAALAGLMPLGVGLLLIDLYALMGVFGVLLAGFGIWAWFAWWWQEHGTLLPRNVPRRRVGGVAITVAVCLLIFVLAV